MPKLRRPTPALATNTFLEGNTVHLAAGMAAVHGGADVVCGATLGIMLVPAD